MVLLQSPDLIPGIPGYQVSRSRFTSQSRAVREPSSSSPESFYRFQGEKGDNSGDYSCVEPLPIYCRLNALAYLSPASSDDSMKFERKRSAKF